MEEASAEASCSSMTVFRSLDTQQDGLAATLQTVSLLWEKPLGQWGALCRSNGSHHREINIIHQEIGETDQSNQGFASGLHLTGGVPLQTCTCCWLTWRLSRRALRRPSRTCTRPWGCCNLSSRWAPHLLPGTSLGEGANEISVQSCILVLLMPPGGLQ